MDCIFCKINDGVIPSYTLYEDDLVKCFLDVNPDCNGHVLIVPKKHILDITEIDSTTLYHIHEVSLKMKTLLEERLNIDGLTLVQNNGSIQLVKHYHLHLKPFYSGNQEIIDVKDIYEKLKTH